MLEVHNTSFPLNSILLLKERLIKVETLFEKYANLTKKYNDLEKLHHQSIENEKRAKKDATKYLEKYCKLSKKCDALSCEIENYEDELKKKKDALEEIKVDYERIISLLEVYKKERSVIESTSTENIKKDKDFLLFSTWRLFKESDRNKNRFAIAEFFRRFKNDLENLKLVDFRNVKSNKIPKSSAAKEAKAVLIPHEKEIANTLKINSIKSDCSIESEKLDPLHQITRCCSPEKCINLKQEEYSGGICKTLDHLSGIKNNNLLNCDTNLETSASLNLHLHDKTITKSEEISSLLFERPTENNYTNVHNIEEIHIDQNVSNDMKQEISEPIKELGFKSDKNNILVNKKKNNQYNNFEEPIISSIINNNINIVQKSNELVEKKLILDYNTQKNGVLDHYNNTGIDIILNENFVNCKTYKKNSKKSSEFVIKLEKNLPLSSENIDYTGSPSKLLILNTDIMNGDLKISSNTFGMSKSHSNLTGVNSTYKSEQKINKMPESMPLLIEESNEINIQPENILINKDCEIKSQTVGRSDSIFNIENETFDTMASIIKNSCEEIENFYLEFGTEKKDNINGNSDNIVHENIIEQNEKSKPELENIDKICGDDLKNEKQKSVCNTHIHSKTEDAGARHKDNNPNKSTKSKEFIESLNDIPDEEINKILQSMVTVALLSPIKDAKQKPNVKSKQKEIMNHKKTLVHSGKYNAVINKKNSDINEISVEGMKSKDCSKLINRSSTENKLVGLKNNPVEEKLTEDKIVQTDAIKDVSKEEKFIQCTEISDKFKKFPITFNNIILKIFKKMKKEILLKRELPNKRKVFNNFVKNCRNHCICLDFVLVLLKILNLPKLNYDKMIKFTVKVLKMMKVEEIKVRKKGTKKKTKNSSRKKENKKDDSSIANENHSTNSFIAPEIENVNNLYRPNENHALNPVAREMEYVNVIHHVIHSPYDIISSNRVEALQRIQPFGLLSRIPQEIQIFNSNSARNFSEENLVPDVTVEQNSQILYDRYKQENNNYVNSEDWVDGVMTRNNFVTMNEPDYLKAENCNILNSENCDKKNEELAPTKIIELKNVSNSLQRRDNEIKNSENELQLVKNSSNHDSSASTDIRNTEKKVCKSSDMASKICDNKIKNVFNRDSLDRLGSKKKSTNESEFKEENIIQSLKNDNKLFSKERESKFENLETKRQTEEPYNFQEKDFYTPPMVSPFRSEILDTEDDDLNHSTSTSYSYKNVENTSKCNAFKSDQKDVTVKKLSTLYKEDKSDKSSEFNNSRFYTSNKLHKKLCKAENMVQDYSKSKKRRISHENFDLSCENISEDKNLENYKQRKKPARHFQQSVICEQPKTLKNPSLQVDGTDLQTKKEEPVNFLDSILSAMTKQAEYFKPTVPVVQICDMNAVSFSAQQTSTLNCNSSNNELKQENELLHNRNNVSINTCLNHTVNSVKEFQNESREENVNGSKDFETSISCEDTTMKRLVEKAIKDFLNVDMNSTIEAEEKMKPCIAILGKAKEHIISKVIVAEIMTNVDEELQEFDRPAPPLTKTQHRLICILTVLTDFNDQFSSINHNILKVIRSKIFPENFFWPDDSLEMATRFYAALCKKLNNFKEIWKFCFKALIYMRQRWSIVVYVVLQIWPDILHDATKVKDNILVNTFVNLILHSSKSEDCRRKRQQNRLLALKHLLKNFYEFEVNCTMEDFTKQIFESFFADALGADKALVLISKCRDWCWTKKNIIPKMTEIIIAWANGKIDDIIGKKSLQIIHQICCVIPITDETINSSTEIILGLERLLNSENLNQISKEKVIKILCVLSHLDNVKDILSSSLEQFSYNKEVFKKIQNAILLSNSKKNKMRETELKKDRNRLMKNKHKRKKKDKRKAPIAEQQ